MIKFPFRKPQEDETPYFARLTISTIPGKLHPKDRMVLVSCSCGEARAPTYSDILKLIGLIITNEETIRVRKGGSKLFLSLLNTYLRGPIFTTDDAGDRHLNEEYIKKLEPFTRNHTTSEEIGKFEWDPDNYSMVYCHSCYQRLQCSKCGVYGWVHKDQVKEAKKNDGGTEYTEAFRV